MEQARGTLVHAVLERLFDLPAAGRTPAAAGDLVAPQWDRLVTEQPELAGLFDAGDTAGRRVPALGGGLLEGYFAVEDPRRLEPAEREALISAVVDDELLIRGYLDRLDVAPDGALRVVDYKTGGAPREAFEARALFQLKFYALVLWRTRGVVPRVLRLLYLKDAEVCDYSPDAEELLRFERTVVALWRAIERATARQDFRPRPSRLCDWCNHQALCPTFGGTPPPFPVAAAPADPLGDARSRPGRPARTNDPPLTGRAAPTPAPPTRSAARGAGRSGRWRLAEQGRQQLQVHPGQALQLVYAVRRRDRQLRRHRQHGRPGGQGTGHPVGESSSPRSARSAPRAAERRSGTAPGAAWSPPPRRRRRSRRSSPGPGCPAPPRPPTGRLEVTRAVGMPAARTAPSSVNAPGRNAQPRCGQLQDPGVDPLRARPGRGRVAEVVVRSASIGHAGAGDRPAGGLGKVAAVLRANSAARCPRAPRCRSGCRPCRRALRRGVAAQRVLQGRGSARSSAPACPRRPDPAGVTSTPSARAGAAPVGPVAGAITQVAGLQDARIPGRSSRCAARRCRASPRRTTAGRGRRRRPAALRGTPPGRPRPGSAAP